MSALAVSVLSRDEARSLTDEVRGDAERLWRKLVELYEGQAHVALGYGSWGAYFKAEFGGSRTVAYRLLDAGRVTQTLEQSPPRGLAPVPSARHAAELAPLKNDPEALKEAWAEVIEIHEKPTAADVREVVQQKVGPMSRKTEMNANAAKRRLYDALSSVNGYCTALVDNSSLDRALASATPDDLAAWERLASESVRALNHVRRAAKGQR